MSEVKVPNKFYDYATDIFEAIEDKNTTKQYLAEFLYEIYEEGCDLGEKPRLTIHVIHRRIKK